MVVIYRHRVLPNFMLGQKSIGNMSYSQLVAAQQSGILPERITLSQGKTQVEQTPTELGVSADIETSLTKLRSSHDWLPIVSLVVHLHAPLVVSIDTPQFSQDMQKIAGSFTVPAQPDHIVLQNEQFTLQQGKPGSGIDTLALSTDLLHVVQSGKDIVAVPMKVLPANSDDTGLDTQIKQLNTSLGAQIGFTYGGKTVHASKVDMTGWFIPSSQTMQVSNDKVVTYINHVAAQLGTTSANPEDMAEATSYVVSKGLSRTFAITPAGVSQIRTYCTSVLDESDSYLADLTGKLAATYNDVRGWNDGGKIAFEHVSSGCQYTVWISAASQMTSFGAICDDYYNCQVGTNVILNYNRWTTGTDPWNKTGGSLEDYRTLMIDHETGHRLGFYDNPTCPAPGQPAPVMMQQSIDLKGCVFNIWPLQTEFTQLDNMLGISAAPVTVSE